MAEISDKFSYVTASNAASFVTDVLVGNGVERENAAIVANCLVQADMRGVDTQ
jgi:LDH2 family malate/lactate/ureidoglycolate dehydrogenase